MELDGQVKQKLNKKDKVEVIRGRVNKAVNKSMMLIMRAKSPPLCIV